MGIASHKDAEDLAKRFRAFLLEADPTLRDKPEQAAQFTAKLVELTEAWANAHPHESMATAEEYEDQIIKWIDQMGGGGQSTNKSLDAKKQVAAEHKRSKRIYVGGLPYSATEEDLNNLFAASGTVTSVTVITDRYTGQGKGFGFVEMSTDAEATEAINTLNGATLGGRTLTVNEAKVRDERLRSGSGGGYGDSRDREKVRDERPRSGSGGKT